MASELKCPRCGANQGNLRYVESASIYRRVYGLGKTNDGEIALFVQSDIGWEDVNLDLVGVRLIVCETCGHSDPVETKVEVGQPPS